MTIKGDKVKLVEEINFLRAKLEDYLSKAEHPTESEVVKISQELDKLIVDFYQEK